jgi:hypothetical protein
MKNKFEVYNAEVTITKVNRAEIGFCPIIRVPIHNQMEADEYAKQGVAIYQKEIKTPNGYRSFYFVEVSVYDLATVARKG